MARSSACFASLEYCTPKRRNKQALEAMNGYIKPSIVHIRRRHNVWLGCIGHGGCWLSADYRFDYPVGPVKCLTPEPWCATIVLVLRMSAPQGTCCPSSPRNIASWERRDNQLIPSDTRVGYFHLLKNMLYFPLLVSKVNYHYWSVYLFLLLFFFPAVLTKWKVARVVHGLSLLL